MKTDLITSIGAAIIGSVIAFLACNALIPAIEPVSYKKLDDASSNYELIEPDVNVFNYRALNPTVEVYVGDCDEYDDYGNCITDQDEDIDDVVEDEEETPEDEELEDEIDELINDDTENEPDQENQNGSTN